MAGRVPDPTALPRVEAAFAAAPAGLVNNPDGSPGIALHAILDDTNIPIIAFPNTSESGSWSEFDIFKQAFFGTAAERADPNWLPYGRFAKELVYRYCMFADTYGGTRSSGLSEHAHQVLPDGTVVGLGGSDFMVTLGAWYDAAGVIPATPEDSNFASDHA